MKHNKLHIAVCAVAAALLNAYVGQSRESPETNMDKSHTDNQKTGQ